MFQIFLFLLTTMMISLSRSLYPLPVVTDGGEIWDIFTRNGPNGAKSFAEQWLVEPFVPYPKDKITLCNTFYWIGALGVSSSTGYFERTYYNIPSHNFAYYSIPIRILPAWTTPDSFSIHIDGKFIEKWSAMNYTASSCETLGRTKSIGGKFEHTGNSLTLRISFNLQNPNSFLLFRDVYFSFRNSAATETPVSYKWADPGCPYGSSSCTCSDSNCNICFSNGATDCARCKWLKSDWGSGCKACTANCELCAGPGVNQCTVCATTHALHPDGSCVVNCPTGTMSIASGGYNICIPRCPVDQLLYWNYTCGESCNLPLQAGTKTCQYPCSQENGEYLYWDGRCESSCPYTVRNETWYFFCDACPPGYWSYQNTSCSPTCQQYFNQTSQGGSQFCNYPCATNEFLYEDGTCHSACKPFYTQRIEQGMFNFCDYPCQTGSWLNSDGKCSSLSNTTQEVLKGTQKASAAITQASSLLTSGSAITVSASVAGRIFFNIKFLNISYSEELQDALKEWSPSFISEGMTPDIPNSIVRKIPQRNIPKMFSQYDDDISSSFLLNYYESLGMLILALFIVITFVLLQILLKFLKKSASAFANVVRKGKVMTQNFLVVTLYGVYGDLVLYSIFEYRTIQLKFDLSLLSFLLSLVLLLLMFIGLFLHLRLLRKYQTIKRQDPDALNAFTNSHPGLQVLYRDYTDKTLGRQAFLITLTTRDIFFSLVICMMFDYPLLQTAIFCLNSLFMIFYLIDRRPFKSSYDVAQQIFFELVGLAVNLSVLLNSMYQNQEDSVPVKRIGKFVIGMNMLYNFSVAGLMLLQILMLIREQWQAYRQKKKSKVVRLAAVHRRLDESATSSQNLSLEQSITVITQQNLSVSRPYSVNLMDLNFENSRSVKRRKIGKISRKSQLPQN